MYSLCLFSMIHPAIYMMILFNNETDLLRVCEASQFLLLLTTPEE